jgi:hypothetical protein
MKSIITALTLILIIACNENKTEGKSENWKIENSTAEKMIAAASGCNDSSGKECEITGSSDTKNVQDYIDSLYPETGFNNSYVKARYTTDADVERYRKLHDLKSDDPAGNVKGQLTYLYKVSAIKPADNNDSVKYFEFLRICPPGMNCSDDEKRKVTESGGRAINPDDWEINEATAKNMIAHLPHGVPLVLFDTNIPVYQAIRAKYNAQSDSFQWVPARYKTYEDQRRYRHLRNYNSTDNRGWARNAETRILKIFPKPIQVHPAVVGDTSYYDLGYSCPPPFPPNCDRKDKN